MPPRCKEEEPQDARVVWFWKKAIKDGNGTLAIDINRCRIRKGWYLPAEYPQNLGQSSFSVQKYFSRSA
jgi:hypothetical protein